MDEESEQRPEATHMLDRYRGRREKGVDAVRRIRISLGDAETAQEPVKGISHPGPTGSLFKRSQGEMVGPSVTATGGLGTGGMNTGMARIALSVSPAQRQRRSAALP
jgi:hypothetical protein